MPGAAPEVTQAGQIAANSKPSRTVGPRGGWCIQRCFLASPDPMNGLEEPSPIRQARHDAPSTEQPNLNGAATHGVGQVPTYGARIRRARAPSTNIGVLRNAPGIG